MTEFTTDELAEIHRQLGHATARHSEELERLQRWYHATADTVLVGRMNYTRDLIAMCAHLQDKTEGFIQERVTEHAVADQQARAELEG